MLQKKPDVRISNSSSNRPPVVVFLGHVDHGKTTLLDAIRKTDVAAGEYGGITQSIGAYQITVGDEIKDKSSETKEKKLDLGNENKITFIDTPGHEAFTKMRSRGASVADIAVLVVAANDSVMPQTAESIKIIKETKIPYIVAINKVDLPEANVDKTVQDLLRHEVMLENYGGDVPFVKVSAKKGEGVNELLDLIRLVADLSDIKGDTSGELEAYVIESRMDKNRGPLATVIVKNGVLRVGQEIFIDNTKSKVRALTDYKSEPLKEAGPGTPAEILGLSVVPQIGSRVASSQQPLQGATLGQSDLKRSDQAGGQSLALILKAGTLGSLEAITAVIPTNVNVISSGVGEISEADILLAKSTKSIVLGFNVKVSPPAQKLAEIDKVLVRTYRIIYELLDELKDAAAGMLEPIETEEVLGTGKIIAEFPFEKMRVCGIKVLVGRIARGDRVRVNREDQLTGESKIKSLRIGKEEANKAEAGKECGGLLDPQVDFKVGDDIMAYRIV